jgi:DNA-binding transcriptional ArsR family regulator
MPGIDAIFSALGDPTRRAIVERLSIQPATVSELAEPFDMSLAAIVQHVQQLEASGLVVSEKTGRVRTCRIEPRAFTAIEDWVDEHRAGWERRFDRLGELLDEED